MKARCNFIVLLLGFLAACTRPSQVPELVEGPSPELVAVDSLMWRQPDSALALLLPWFDSCGDVSGNVSTTFDLHYAHLLLSELLYKNYCEQTNRAELLQAESYFDSISLIIDNHSRIPWSHCGPSFRECGTQSPKHKDDLAFLTARAHYMDGVGHYERDSLVPACRECMKALEIMEGRFEENGLTGHKALFMAYAFSRLTDVYSDLYLHEQAIYFARHALRCFHRFGSSSAPLSSLLNEIGAQYEMMEQFDSADYYYCRAIAVLGDTNTLLYRDIAFHQTYLGYKKDGCQADVALSRLLLLLSKSESDSEKKARCLSIGELYYDIRLYDSAKVYLESAYYGNTSVNSKKQAAEWLVDICKEMGNEPEALAYASYLVPFSNSEENDKSEVKSQLAELYKGFGQQKLRHSHQLEKEENLKWTLMAFVCLLVVLLAAVLINHHNRTGRHILENQIKDEHYAHEMQQKALSGKLKKSNEALRDTKEQLEKFNNKEFQKQPIQTRDYVSFAKTPVCCHILDTVNRQKFKSKIDYGFYKEYALQKEEIKALRVAADEKLDDFTFRLKKQFPSLTDEDVTYCCLYLLGLSDADIAALVQRAYPTVCERKRKIRRIVGEENSLHFTLRNMP
ncbi:MAG: hypothetical protein IKG95_08285 [Bacteroidales bacterium]|nr:hypothetical protein [Bacteroidales bacterium]